MTKPFDWFRAWQVYVLSAYLLLTYGPLFLRLGVQRGGYTVTLGLIVFGLVWFCIIPFSILWSLAREYYKS